MAAGLTARGRWGKPGRPFHPLPACLVEAMAGKAGIAQVEALMRARRFSEAARMLIGLAGEGDVSALAQLAGWRISGDVIRRDLAEARALLGKAGAQGDGRAAMLHA